MSENNKKRRKALDNTSKIGKIAFKVALGANIISAFAFVLVLLRLGTFSLYALITFVVCLAVSMTGYAVLLVDISNYSRINKSTH